MTKEEKKAFKKGKIEKKIEAKTEIMSEDIYEDKVFACYAEKVAAAQKVHFFPLLLLPLITCCDLVRNKLQEIEQKSENKLSLN